METKWVKTDYSGCEYITAGKPYEVDESSYIVNDNGNKSFILMNGCVHLDGRHWNYCEAPVPTMQTGTLKELDVKAGDVVEWVGYDVPPHTLDYIDDGVYVFDTAEGPYAHPGNTPEFRIISRAPAASKTPKTWGEMTDAEKGALLLAKHEGKVVEAHDSEDWYVPAYPTFANGVAYRVKPTPSHLPLTVGEYYQLENGQTWECIFVRGDTAWLVPTSCNTAYTFNATTGENISQGGGRYSVKGLAQ